MLPTPLDDVDRRILYHLQEDPMRPMTAVADAIDVADNTVRNRIEKLESEGIIEGYTVEVNYDRAGIQHHYLFICTARVSERERFAGEVGQLPGVVEVMTLMTGTQNVFVTAVGRTKADITDIAREIDRLGLSIEREHLVWQRRTRPYSGFQLEEDS